MDVVRECGFKDVYFSVKFLQNIKNSFGLFFMGNCMNFWLCHMGFEISHVSLPNFETSSVVSEVFGSHSVGIH